MGSSKRMFCTALACEEQGEDEHHDSFQEREAVWERVQKTSAAYTILRLYSYTILYYTILYYTILYYTILYYTILY